MVSKCVFLLFLALFDRRKYVKMVQEKSITIWAFFVKIPKFLHRKLLRQISQETDQKANGKVDLVCLLTRQTAVIHQSQIFICIRLKIQLLLKSLNHWEQHDVHFTSCIYSQQPITGRLSWFYWNHISYEQ